MRVAVVYFPASKRDKLSTLSQALARGIERQGHQVDVVDGVRDSQAKLTTYQYIALGSEQTNLFGGKLPNKVKEFLAGAGMIAGKKSCAFILRHAIGERRTLSRLMGAMEREGMFLRVSHSFTKEEEAEAVGTDLTIE